MRIRTSMSNKTIVEIISLICVILICPSFGYSQTTTSPTDEASIRIGTVTACEEWISRVTQALDKGEKSKDSYFIVIAVRGFDETSSKISLKRLKTLKEYIATFDTKLKLVFAEGERINNDGGGIIEIYIEGKLVDSLGVRPKSDIPLRGCNP